MAEADSKKRPDKSDLVNEVMRRARIPSWEAWDMTVDELNAKLKGKR